MLYATSPTKNPILNHPGLNPHSRRKHPASSCLSYDTVFIYYMILYFYYIILYFYKVIDRNMGLYAFYKCTLFARLSGLFKSVCTATFIHLIPAK
jgi:hypothetical protein